MSVPISAQGTHFWRRLAAGLMDLALLVGSLGLLEWLLGEIGLRGDGLTDTDTAAVTTLPLLAGIPALLLFWRLFQATPGKLLLDCRIVDARDGNAPKAWQLLVRCVSYGLSAAPLGLGFLWMLWDRRRQGWHDKLARTRVVDDDESRKSLVMLMTEVRSS